MRTTTLLTAAAFVLTAWAAPAAARTATDTVSLSACGGENGDTTNKRKKRKGDGNSYVETRSACGGEDGDTNKRKKRKGDGSSYVETRSACGGEDGDTTNKRKKRKGDGNS